MDVDGSRAPAFLASPTEYAVGPDFSQGSSNAQPLLSLAKRRQNINLSMPIDGASSRTRPQDGGIQVAPVPYCGIWLPDPARAFF